MLSLLVYNPSLIGRTMVDDVLKSKRLDGVDMALAKIADANFAGGRQLLDLRPVPRQLPMPVQVIWGREDRMLPVEQAKDLRATIRVTVHEACGHLPQLARAPEVANLLRGFAS